MIQEFEPAQSKAITSLLEIDFKDAPDLNPWDQKFNSQKTIIKRRAFQKGHHIKVTSDHKNILKIQQPTSGQFEKYNPELVIHRQDGTIHKNASQENYKKMTNSQSNQFNEGEYWLSRVNWMPEPKGNQQLSQPKLNKKYSYGYQVNSRSKRSNRYSHQKNREKQYKTNLIYSLLNYQDEFIQRKRENLQKQKYSSTTFIESNSLRKMNGHLKKVNSKQLPSKSYVKQIFKRLYSKNHSKKQSVSTSYYHQSQQERGTMIRQLLINLQHSKEENNALSINEDKINANKKQCKIIKQFQIQFEKMAVSQGQNPLSQQKNKRILDLNLQAEKVYKNRSINRWNIKKPLNIAKIK